MEDKVNTGNAAVDAAEGNPVATKKSSKSKAKAQQKKSPRPPTSEMVTTAIKELKDRKGSSLQAIKKYIVATYKVDAEKVAPFIRRYLKTAVSSGVVVQTKGKGASGSFKLSADKPKTTKPKTRVQRTTKPKTKKIKIWVHKDEVATTRKPAATKKTAATAKKAVESPKKQPVQKRAAAVKPAVEKKRAAAEPKSPKAKKAVKAPAAKTKTPKPKKVAATKAVKAAAKK